MKGIMHWLKSSSKMKRWMFLILIGIILTCYGISDILVQKEMQFSEAGKVVVIFAIGFVCIVIGLIMLNKRNMELFIEATDDRMKNKKNVNDFFTFFIQFFITSSIEYSPTYSASWR